MKEPVKYSEFSPFEPEWWYVTLASIGDAVITIDADGRITFLNSVAVSLTGWALAEAVGQPLESVFRLANEQTREPAKSPTVRALRNGLVVGMANHSVLIVNGRPERPIDGSAAPIRNVKGEVAGVVLVFRDITERRQAEKGLQDALAYANDIVATLREPFLVLDKNLQIQTASAAFLETFRVTREETEGRLIYDLGNRQWDIPRLRKLLEEVLPQNHSLEHFDVEHDFPTIGRKIMLLNARRLVSEDSRLELILLAIEDITDRRTAANQVERLAFVDSLTGLPNRPRLLDRLNVALANARRASLMLAVMFLDLDRFKIINDSFGHSAGDVLLKRVAERISELLRETDTIGRPGGDEFILVISEMERAEEAAIVARKIQLAMKAPFFIESRELYVTASIGISIFPLECSDAESLIRQADQAMYAAKRDGRDRFRFSSDVH